MKNYNLILILFLLLTSCSEEGIEETSFGTLTGKVVAKGENTPLENVKISSTPVSNTVFTDSNGDFEIIDVPIGEYSFQAELDEFQTGFEAANILEDKSVNIVFELDSVNLGNVAPLKTILLSPLDNAENILTSTEFVWSSASNDSDKISYELQIRNGSTNETQVFEEIQDTTFLVDNLSIGKNYFWQVSASDGINTPVESSISSFTTNGGQTNRFFYVRNIDGNNVIFSGTEGADEINNVTDENELQLTSSTLNSFRPFRNNTVEKLAFLRLVGAETHLFTMNTDGTDLLQVTDAVPLSGFRQNEVSYTWYDNGASFFYPSFNKLYSINADGSGLQKVYEIGSSSFISEVAVNAVNGLVVIKVNDLNGYNARIVIINVVTGADQEVVITGQPGAIGGLDFSFDGTKVLYTRDVSGTENSEYRQLDSRIFEYDLVTDSTVEIDTDKTSGTNDLDAKYSPDGGFIIFTNVSNDGISEPNIYRSVENQSEVKKKLFTNAFMPNWE